MTTNINTREEANVEEKKAGIGIWEMVGYLTIVLAVIGQICVGRYYIWAQSAFLVGNVFSIARDYALKLPRANKVKDFTFAAITVGLILLRLF